MCLGVVSRVLIGAIVCHTRLSSPYIDIVHIIVGLICIPIIIICLSH